MRLGICCGPHQAEGDSLGGRALRLQSVLREAGADYFEMGVASVMGEDFGALQEALRPLEMRPEAFNSFIPAQHRLTGEDANHAAALDYCARALERAHSIGGRVVVLGSAGARRVPAGFEASRAWEQFRAFCILLGPIAEGAGVTIALEPLNGREDNLLLSVSEGARLVDEVAQPSIRLLADLYHMVQEGEAVENIARAGGRLAHTHLASSSRVPPGTDADDCAPYEAFFAACQAAGTDVRCSYEGKIGDLQEDARTLIGFLRPKMSAGAASA